ncbi:uncharacterized protein LOC100213409 isoform X3 [Hydra vulgaris]|uniref:Uncharacterized protein LOC100213409 isoform X3 n=1 Tax=Hydra vulgaris TaxID=6087 RepID=A0ABM4DDZ3_HYDVU
MQMDFNGKLTIESINVEEDTYFELNCNLYAEKNISLIWKKDRIPIQENATIYNLKGIRLGIKKANYFDRGLYECASLSNNKTIQKFFLRVKNPYRAVWPSIGLLLQVIVLATIIFFSERQKSKKVLSTLLSEEERRLIT